MQHTIAITQDTVRCSACHCSWKKEPESSCPGCHWYDYNGIPWAEMTTITQLKQKKLRPKDKSKPDGCYYRAKGRSFVYLYRIDEAIPQKELSEKQQAALEKMQQALKSNHTCEKCGWYDKAHGQNRYQYVSVIKIDEEEKRYCSDCREAIEWRKERAALERQMKELLESNEPIAILDTETTGLPGSHRFQVVEVSVIDKHGTVLFDKLIKPDISIPQSAVSVHGVSDEMVAGAPTFAEAWPELEKILSKYSIWCYNADFDRRAILSSAHYAAVEVPKEISRRDRWNCMMLAYAEYFGDWNEYRESYTWKPLSFACEDLGVAGNGYHRALGDVNNTLGVMKALARRSIHLVSPLQGCECESEDNR